MLRSSLMFADVRFKLTVFQLLELKTPYVENYFRNMKSLGKCSMDSNTNKFPRKCMRRCDQFFHLATLLVSKNSGVLSCFAKILDIQGLLCLSKQVLNSLICSKCPIVSKFEIQRSRFPWGNVGHWTVKNDYNKVHWDDVLNPQVSPLEFWTIGISATSII